MAELAVKSRLDPASERVVRTRTAGFLVAGISCVLVGLHVVWLVRFRRDYVTEWDESGYLQFALSNFDALHDQGLWTFAKTVGGRETFGPLLPLVTSLAYPIFGRGIFGSLLVLPLFFAGLVAATFALARQLVSDSWAVIAAFVVASIPAVTDYSRLFHFAVPATACMTAALWALVRSEGFRRSRWAALFGLFVALTLLSRTMTVAYVPGLALAAGVQFVVRRQERRIRIRNVGLAVAAAALVAGPWYIRNARSVYDNLAGSGYGEGAAPFGRDYPFASWGYWSKELRLDLSYLGLPLAGALLLCVAAAVLFYALHRPRVRADWDSISARTTGVLALGVVVLEGYLALTSSRNEGTAFALPWIPALVVLAVTAAARIPSSAVRRGLASVLVVTSLGAALSKSGWIEPLAEVRTLAIPGLGAVTVTDGRGIIQLELLGDEYDPGKPTQPPPAMHRRWLPLARDVVGWSLQHAEQRGEPLNLTVGLDDRIFSWSRLTLAAQLWFHQFLPVYDLRFPAGGDTVASYRRELLVPRVDNALIVGDPPPVSSITRTKVEAAARSLGFAPVKGFTMPDGRKIWIWWRDYVESS